MATLVKGPIKLVTDRPDTVRKVNLRAPELRLHGAGIVTDHNDDIPVRDGQVEFEALPGPAVLTLVTAGGAPLRSVDIVVPDEDTATLAECLDHIYAYEPPAVGRAQYFAREAGEHAARAEAGADRVGSAEQVGAWVEEATTLRGDTVEAADRAQAQAGVATEQAGFASAAAGAAAEDARRAETARQGAETIQQEIPDKIDQELETKLPGELDTRVPDELDKHLPGELDERVPPLVASSIADDRAVADAAAAAVSGAAEGMDLMERSTAEEAAQALSGRISAIEPIQAGEVSGTAWAHTTPDGHRLPLGYTEDGRLDDHARAVWREEVNHTRNVPEDFDTAHAVTADTGHLLVAIQRDGTVEIPSLATSVLGAPQKSPTQDKYHHVLTTQEGHIIVGVGTDGSVTIPGLATPEQAPQVAASETYWHPDGTLAPVQARRDLIVGWGASGLEGMLPELTAEFSDLPVTYVNHAKGGESVQHHAMRMGSRPALIEPVTIPATGPVNVRASNTLPANQMRPFTGWLAGIHGTMSVTSNQLIFTRTTPGDELTLTEHTKFIPDIDPIYRDATAIFLPGENNLPRDEVDLVKEVTEGMLKYLRPLMPRILVMGLKGNLDFTVDDVRWDRMHQINDFLLNLVGPDHYIDRQAILTGPEIWELTGLTPTTEDLEYQAAGKMPPSVAADTLHLNNIGDAAIAKVVRARMHTLSWY